MRIGAGFLAHCVSTCSRPADFAWIRRLFANGSMQATGYIGRGGGGYSGDGGPASAAQTYNTLQFTLDGLGGAFVPVSALSGQLCGHCAASLSHRCPLHHPDATQDGNFVRRVFPNGTITLFAGSTVGGYSGDSGPSALALMTTPTSVAISSDAVTGGGAVFIAGVLRKWCILHPRERIVFRCILPTRKLAQILRMQSDWPTLTVRSSRLLATALRALVATVVLALLRW